MFLNTDHHKPYYSGRGAAPQAEISGADAAAAEGAVRADRLHLLMLLLAPIGGATIISALMRLWG